SRPASADARALPVAARYRNRNAGQSWPWNTSSLTVRQVYSSPNATTAEPTLVRFFRGCQASLGCPDRLCMQAASLDTNLDCHCGEILLGFSPCRERWCVVPAHGAGETCVSRYALGFARKARR